MPAASGRYDVVTVRSKSHGPAMWPFDLALGAISTLVLILVLRLLKFDDPKPLKNAWTYLIAVPGIVVVISMCLRLVSNRLIERTLQISFLISVAIHLLFVVGALNMVLFSRYWPDVYQSVTFESAPKKVVVPSYFKPSAANSKVRPEYLKPVKTESEVKQNEPTAARREVDSQAQLADMPNEESSSQVPETFVTSKPKPAPSEPSIAAASADLERQRISEELPKAMQQIALPDLDPNVSSMPELSASKADLPRTDRAPADISAPNVNENAETFEPRKANPLLPPSRARREVLPELSQVLAESSAIERAVAEPTQPTTSQVPTVTTRSETNTPKPVEAREPLATRSDSPSRTETAQANVEVEKAEVAINTKPEMVRSPKSQQPVDAMPGDVRTELSRATAGGKASPTPEAVATLQGPKAFESRATAPTSRDASAAIPEARVDKSRQTHRDSSPSSLSASAKDLAPSNEQIATLSSQPNRAAQGLSTVRGSEGPAIVDDQSNRMGASDAQVRSRSSSSGSNADGDNGTASIAQIGDKAIPVPERSNGSTQGQANATDAPRADLSRTGSQGQGDASVASTLDSPQEAEVGQSSPAKTSNNLAPQRGQGNLDRELTKSIDQQGEPIRRGRRDSNLDEGAELGDLRGRIDQQAVPLPETKRAGSNDAGSRESPLDASIDRLNRPSRSSSPLQDGSSSLDSSVALSTESNDIASKTPNLDRGASDRRRLETAVPDIREGDLSTQRFRRQEVGGPTLAGRGVPIPTPAFQRRMDRSHEMSDSEQLGPLGPEVEQTIERGLAFLASRQRQDGSWHLEDFDTKVQIRSHTAATGLALLAFQGAGYTHQSEKYATTVNKALEFLVKNQKKTGDLYIRMDAESDLNAWLYSHSIAALALTEAYGMTTDPNLKPAAQKAVDFMVASQDKKLGGWRYIPNSGSDTSVTGWFMMALKSAQLAGLDVKPDVFEGIKKWLDRNQASTVEPHLYRYNFDAPNTPMQQHGRIPTPIMTSIGMLSRLYTGWKRDNVPMQDAAEYLLRFPPAQGTVDQPLRDTYYWYYATQFFFHMGGDYWRKWNGQLQPLLVESQVLEGEHKGSWEPLGDIPDAWGRFGGRLYVTTLNLLSLEVYYRHLPLYEATGKGD